MFTKKDDEQIDRVYFEVLNSTSSHITLMSRNTGHFWDIYYQTRPGGKYGLVISHKHKRTDTFHIQPRMHPRTVLQAQEMFKSHDAWQLQGRPNS